MVTGAYFEGFEGTFGGIAVLVVSNVDRGFEFNFFLDATDLGVEGVKERDIKPDTVAVEIVNHGKRPMIHDSDVVRVWTVRVVYSPEKFHVTYSKPHMSNTHV